MCVRTQFVFGNSQATVFVPRAWTDLSQMVTHLALICVRVIVRKLLLLILLSV